MTARRHTASLAAALMSVALLAGCGGSDGDPQIKPTTAAPSATVAADPDGYTPEQREVADVVTKWNKAAFSVTTDQVGPAIEPYVTPDVLNGVVASESKQKPGAYLGEVILDVKDVTVSGDTATVTACQDGSQAYRVAKGETEAAVGDPLVGASQLTVTLVKQDGTWLISRPEGKQVRSC